MLNKEKLYTNVRIDVTPPPPLVRRHLHFDGPTSLSPYPSFPAKCKRSK